MGIPGPAGLRWVVTGVGVGALAAFVGSVITARGLRPEDRGVYLEIVAVTQIASFLAVSGFILPITSLANGSVSSARQLMRQAQWTVVAATAVLSVLSVGVSAKLITSPTASLAEVSIAVGLLCPVTVYERWILIEVRVANDFKTLGVCSALPTIGSSLALLAFELSGGISLTRAVVATALGPVATLSYLLVIRSAEKRKAFAEAVNQFEVGLERSMLDVSNRRLMRLVISDLATFGPGVLTDRLELLLVGAAISPAAASVLGVAKSVSAPLGLVGATVQTYLGPRIAAAAPEARLGIMLRAERFVLRTAIVLTGVTALLAIPLVPRIFGEAYRTSIVPALILLVGAVLSIGVLISSIMLRVEFLYRVVLISSYLALTVLIVVGYWAAHNHGLVGYATVSISTTGLLYVFLRSQAVRIRTGVYR